MVPVRVRSVCVCVCVCVYCAGRLNVIFIRITFVVFNCEQSVLYNMKCELVLHNDTKFGITFV